MTITDHDGAIDPALDDDDDGFRRWMLAMRKCLDVDLPPPPRLAGSPRAFVRSDERYPKRKR
jgi:hypothetical protein